MDVIDAAVAVLKGLPLTLLLAVSAMLIGVVGALPVSLGLQSRHLVLRLLCRLCVDLVRGIPIIVWLFVLKFGIVVGTFKFDALQSAIVGLGLVSIAYLAEIYRGGMQTVPRGQTEAAEALGLTPRTRLFYVVLPQAFTIVSPSIATYFVGLLKDTSIASTIVVAEMVFQAQSFARQNPTLAGLLPYVIAGGLYIVLSLPVAYASRRLDARLRRAVI